MIGHGRVLVLDAAKGGVATAWMLYEMQARGVMPAAIQTCRRRSSRRRTPVPSARGRRLACPPTRRAAPGTGSMNPGVPRTLRRRFALSRSSPQTVSYTPRSSPSDAQSPPGAGGGTTGTPTGWGAGSGEGQDERGREELDRFSLGDLPPVQRGLLSAASEINDENALRYIALSASNNATSPFASMKLVREAADNSCVVYAYDSKAAAVSGVGGPGKIDAAAGEVRALRRMTRTVGGRAVGVMEIAQTSAAATTLEILPLTPARVAELLILQKQMPRSLVACMAAVVANLQDIRNDLSQDTERLAGKLHATLQFGLIDDILEEGLHDFLTNFLACIEDLGNRISCDFLVPAASLECA